jgi:hypothetical protein
MTGSIHVYNSHVHQNIYTNETKRLRVHGQIIPVQDGQALEAPRILGQSAHEPGKYTSLTQRKD